MAIYTTGDFPYDNRRSGYLLHSYLKMRLGSSSAVCSGGWPKIPARVIELAASLTS